MTASFVGQDSRVRVQVVSRRHVTSDTRFRSHVSPGAGGGGGGDGICGGQSGTGDVFLKVMWFSHVSTISPMLHIYFIHLQSTVYFVYNRSNRARRHTDGCYLFILNVPFPAGQFAVNLCKYPARVIRSEYKMNNVFYSLSVGVMVVTVTRAYVCVCVCVWNSGTSQHPACDDADLLDDGLNTTAL
jgi:hypothetical protein